MADTNLDILLKRLRLLPIPEAPVPADLGPLNLNTSAAYGALNPEPVPPQFAQPAAPDMGFVSQYAGAEPARPVIQPPSTLAKLAAVLSGIGAGPEYGMALREERERPIREYNAALERYQGRRAQGLEAAERRAEREADRASRAAELQYEREYKTWLKKMDIRQDEADQRTKQAFELLKIREAERIADEKQAAKEKADKERQRRNIEFELGEKNFAPPNIAKEIAGYIVDGKPMSAATEKWRSLRAQKLQAQLDKLTAGGGSGGAGKNEVELVGPDGRVLDRLPYAMLKFTEFGQLKGYPRGTMIRSTRGQAAPQPFPETSGLPPGIGALTPQGPTEEDVRGYAKRFKMSRERARKELMGR